VTHTFHGESELFDAYKSPDSEDLIDDILDSFNPEMVNNIYEVHAMESLPSKRDYNLLRPFFAWAPAETIWKTIGDTTQYARGRVSETI
jgi:hypothetical protein